MAHFAELDENNVVVNVIVVASEHFQVDGVENEEAGKDLLEEWYGHRRWIQTSYTGSIRGRYASIGGTYRDDLKQFIDAKPYSSWILNTKSGEWESPKPRPRDTRGVRFCYWDEDTEDWVVIKE